MRHFLSYVAEDIYDKYGNDLSRTAVVFPNKRAALFFNGYLAERADRPVWSPAYKTISELFREQTGMQTGDPIRLTAELYRCFLQVTGQDAPGADGKTESIDHFYGWGQLLLADFDDIDKNLADARKVFANLSALRDMDYRESLTPEQQETLESFFGLFQGALSPLKKDFARLWQYLPDVYDAANRRFREIGLTYEGALYRQVAERDDLRFPYDHYAFVGFNLVQPVEQLLFRKLQEQGKASFYYDYDRYYLSGRPDKDDAFQPLSRHEAGQFIRPLKERFPDALDGHDDVRQTFAGGKDITFISSPTDNAQARYISRWLREEGKHRIADGRDTAIVLCDEQLLQMALHCLPEEVDKVNITTGYPLSQSPVVSFVNALLRLRLQGEDQQKDTFRTRDIRRVVRHSLAPCLSERLRPLLAALDRDHKYYPTRQRLTADGDDAVRLLFGPLDHRHDHLLQWAAGIIRLVAVNVRNGADGASDGHAADPLLQESLFKTYTILNRLSRLVSEDRTDEKTGERGPVLQVQDTTLLRLLGQIINTTSVPFHGEPAEGIQIMGVLETRNLDFRHLLLLSCNEGNMPKGVSDSSFIPHLLRKAYGLTTIDNKVAVYSYYFHRLLQRAEDITIVYCNNSEDKTKSGEMSRFMTQLMVEDPHIATGRHRLRHQALVVSGTATPQATPEVAKDQDIMDKLQAKGALSPSALNRYMRCPLMFFYQDVCGMRQTDEEDEEGIDGRMFGDIFHRAAQLTYEAMGYREGTETLITKDQIKIMLDQKQEATLERIVDQAFSEQLFHNPGQERPQYNGLQLINRRVIIDYLKRLLEKDKDLAPFTIVLLEKKAMETLTDIPGRTAPLAVGGVIDRLDRVKGRLRVIDYKTGHRPADLDKVESVEEIFNPGIAITKKHTDYFLQTMLYSVIVRHDTAINPDGRPVVPALLFIQQAGAEGYDPVLQIGKKQIDDILTLEPDYRDGLRNLLAEIFNPDTPFRATGEKSRCTYCPFAEICGNK